MPQITIGKGVIVRHLQVGGSAVVHLFHRESQTIQKYAAFSFRGYQSITCYFFVLFISFHVLEANPASAPASRCQLETEPIRHISLGGKELKTNGILLGGFIINP